MPKKAHIPYILTCHLRIDADPVPDPAYHVDADPDPDFYLMRMWTRKQIRIRTGIVFHADADPGYPNDADPDPQHCL